MAASWFRWLRPWWRTALDLAFPPRCAACGVWAAGAPLCRNCIAAFPVAALACPRCALPRDTPSGDGLDSAPCPGCRALGAVRRLVAAGLYEGALRKVLLALKYEARTALADPLGAWLAESIAADRDFAACDVIVPVPLHAVRQRERGYNQAAEIARALGDHIGAPVLDALIRTRATAPQSTLGAADRLRNLRGVFSVRIPPSGRAVILVDDVVTTGATLAACAAALTEGGAREVLGAAVARTPRYE